MPAIVHHPKQNLILAQLRVEEGRRVLPALESVQLVPGQILCEFGASITEVYFPTTGLVSLQSIAEEDASAQLAMTGREGMVGVALALGDDLSPYRVVAQNAGSAYRLHGELLRWELDQVGDLRRLVLRYTQTLMMQMAQTAVCNRHHRIDQQVCRWLLQILDRLPATEIRLTQTQIAQMLGVRREAVTAAAGMLQRDGVITYVRGCITVLDRKAMEQRTCACYAALHHIDGALQHALPDALKSRRARPKPVSVRAFAELKLRQQAESTKLIVEADVAPLMHELQVHQIELELSNEALTEAFDEAEAARSLYADIYDFSPVAYVTIDVAGVIRQINLAGAILLGIKRSELMRHRFYAFVNPLQRVRFEQFLESVYLGRTRSSAEFELVTLTTEDSAPHRLALVQIDAVANEDSDECRMVVSDITSHRETEARLAESEKRYHGLIDALPISVIIAQDGVLRLANPHALRLFGYPAEEITDRSFLQLIAPEDREKVAAAHQQRMAGGDAPVSYEVGILDKEGGRVDGLLYASTILWEGRPASLAVIEDVTERKRLENQLQEMASTDPLTGLPNRRHFIGRLEEELARMRRREDHSAALLMLDLDHFKRVNDSLGHAAGDAVLRSFAALLRKELRKADSAGRIGGEEFAVLMPETDRAAAGIFAERLRSIVEQSAHDHAGQLIPVTVSIGVTVIDVSDSSVDEPLARADEAMYKAKRRGRNCIELCDGNAPIAQ